MKRNLIMNNKIVIPTERQEQIVLHQWCKRKKLHSFAVPNGGSRNKIEASNLKKEGVTAGVSDYIVMLPNKILFIELKRARKRLKSGKLSISHTNVSDEQKIFLNTINEEFCKYASAVVCYGAREAIEVVEEYINAKH